MSENTIASRTQDTDNTWRLFIVIFLKTTALSFVFVFIFLLITALGLGLVANSKLTQFEKLTGTHRALLFETVKAGVRTEPVQRDNRVTFLILGVDTLANRGSALPLTDTMLLASIHLDSAEVHLLPIPRDLWSSEYRTKVNALYSYGVERNPDKPEQFPLEVIETMTGVDIQHTIVLSMETLSELIDSVDGITVDVPVAFRDDQFPRSDVDVTTERDPAKLYKVVEFTTGQQTMSGERALEYIRSRHSNDDEGSDTARSSRQQLVIRSLIQRLIDAQTLKSVDRISKLYTLYQNEFDRYVPLTEVISIAKVLYPQRDNLNFYNEHLSVYPDVPEGVIEHPPERQYSNQWVYIIRDKKAFEQEVQTKLLQNQVKSVQYKEE